MVINLTLVTFCRVRSSRRRRAEEVDASSSEESAAKLVPPSRPIGQTSSWSDSMFFFSEIKFVFPDQAEQKQIEKKLPGSFFTFP